MIHTCKLQCGRIYKDAEIGALFVYCAALWCSFNVAASIKMRKSVCAASVITAPTIGFNVAASIKMRKSPDARLIARTASFASMWPHL